VLGSTPRRRHEQDPAACRANRGRGGLAWWWSTSGTPSKRQHTMRRWRRSCAPKSFHRLGPMLVNRPSGAGGELFALALLAWAQRRRVTIGGERSAAEAAELALAHQHAAAPRRSTRHQVAAGPSFTLFVNDPSCFGELRRYWNAKIRKALASMARDQVVLACRGRVRKKESTASRPAATPIPVPIPFRGAPGGFQRWCTA